MQRRIWITWETQRRSIELAKKFGCDLQLIEHKGIMRYPLSVIKTVSVLNRERPDVLFVQNPSMILAALGCLCKLVFGYFLVVDRHTTFLLDKDYKNIPWVLLFQFLSRLTIRCADITVVTNSQLADMVKKLGGEPYILPDMLPSLSESGRIELKGKHNILMVSSFAADEPVQEVLTAMKDFLDGEVYLYITGNYKKLDGKVRCSAPSNVEFTGFLDEQDYINMLFSCDAIMVLTTASACMLCGCYEAVSVCRPLITSDKDVLRGYFTDSVFVDNTAYGISEGIKVVITDMETYRKKIELLKVKLNNQWNDLFRGLEKRLASASSGHV